MPLLVTPSSRAIPSLGLSDITGLDWHYIRRVERLLANWTKKEEENRTWLKHVPAATCTPLQAGQRARQVNVPPGQHSTGHGKVKWWWAGEPCCSLTRALPLTGEGKEEGGHLTELPCCPPLRHA